MKKNVYIIEYKFNKAGKLIKTKNVVLSAILAVICSIILIIPVFANIYLDNGLYNIIVYSSYNFHNIITILFSHFIEILLLCKIIKTLILVIKSFSKEKKFSTVIAFILSILSVIVVISIYVFYVYGFMRVWVSFRVKFDYIK